VTLSAGTNISISRSGNTITISSTAPTQCYWNGKAYSPGAKCESGYEPSISCLGGWWYTVATCQSGGSWSISVGCSGPYVMCGS
jgi:hypothetical protein